MNEQEDEKQTADEPKYLNERERRWGRIPGLTLHGQGMRDALRESALRLIAAHGYSRTTLRAIAGELNVSPSLVYRYYPSKSRILLELCDDLASSLFVRSIQVPRGSWCLRFAFLVQEGLEIVRERRKVISALLVALMDDAEPLPLGVSEAARRVRGILEYAVQGAEDAPCESEASKLVRLLERAYLGILVGHLLDRSKAQRATHELLSALDVAPLVKALGA